MPLFICSAGTIYLVVQIYYSLPRIQYLCFNIFCIPRIQYLCFNIFAYMHCIKCTIFLRANTLLMSAPHFWESFSASVLALGSRTSTHNNKNSTQRFDKTPSFYWYIKIGSYNSGSKGIALGFTWLTEFHCWEAAFYYNGVVAPTTEVYSITIL